MSEQPATPSQTSFLQLLERAAGVRTGITIADGRDETSSSWAAFHDDARRAAAVLQRRGVGPGSLVCIVGDSSPFVLASVTASVLAGAHASVVSIPVRTRTEAAQRSGIRDRLRVAGPQVVLAEDRFAEQDSAEFTTLSASAVEASAQRVSSDSYDPPRVSDADLALVQFTSGSTAASKGVMVTHGQLAHNITAIATAARLDPSSDVMASWLPLFHDMGLIGFFLLPMALGIDAVLSSPRAFFRDPASWMETVSRYRATVTGAPNFAYAVAASRLSTATGDLDLSPLRLAFNGAEPIDPSSVEAFIEAAARHRFDGRAMFCVYGLAEATLAVTFPEPGAGMSVDAVDAGALTRGGRPVPLESSSASRLVRLGRPLPGTEVRVVASDGRALAERIVGEIEIRGASTTRGYVGQPAESAALHHGDWIRTGDLGYFADHDLVVCGRLKDIVIVGGRNILPEDIERAAASVAGVRRGNVIAFAVPGRRTERLVVVAERRSPECGRSTLAEVVRDAVDVMPHDIVFVRPGSLPKTSSGKLRRAECRRLYEAGRLESDD